MKEKFYLLIVLEAIFLIGLLLFSKNAVHYPHGDGIDYVLMTESLYQHDSPDLRYQDPTSYINYMSRRGLYLYRADDFYHAKSIGPGIPNKGYFTSERNGKVYNYHFWFYSLLNVPARAVLENLEADIRLAALATNLLIILFGIWMIFFLVELSLRRKIVLSLLMVFSPLLWYLDWAHTEVYSSVLIFLSLLCFFEKKWYAAMLFASFSAIQNQALLLVAFTIFIYILYKEGIRKKILFKSTIYGIWGILPMFFYLIHYGDYSLIDGQGYLELGYMSWKRLWSFFFDLNQGMILGIPLALLGVMAALFYDLFKRKVHLEYLFLIPLFVMIAVIIQTSNWNHGAVVMNRYAVWCSIIVLLIFERRIRRLGQTTYYTLLGLSIVSQAFLIFGQHSFNKVYWSSNEINQLTKWIWNNHPSYYNPEPQIFKGRVHWPELSYTDSVQVYASKDGRIKKIQVSERSIEQLKQRGISAEKVDSIKGKLDYLQGWAYLDLPLLRRLGYDQEKDTLISFIEKTKKERQMKEIIAEIKANPQWMQKLKNGESDLDSLIRNEAAMKYSELKEDYLSKK